MRLKLLGFAGRGSTLVSSVVDNLWAGFVRSNSYTRFKTGALLNGQLSSLALQPPASLMCSSASRCAYSSSNLVTSTPISLPRVCSCPVLNGSYSVGRKWKVALLVAFICWFSIRVLLLVFKYLIMRSHGLQVPQYEEDYILEQSFTRRPSVECNIHGFGTEMNRLDPSISLGVLGVVDGLGAGVVFTVEDGCGSKSPPFQPTSQKIEPS